MADSSLTGSVFHPPRTKPTNCRRNSISAIFSPLPSSTRNILANHQKANKKPLQLPILGRNSGIIIRTNYAPKNDNPPGPIPHVLSSDNSILNILRRLTDPMQFTFLVDSIPFPDKEFNDIYFQQESDFERLAQYVFSVRGSIPQTELDMFFKIVQIQLFRNFPQLPESVFLSDVPARITVSNIKSILTQYHILSYLIIKSPRHLIEPLITQSFVTNVCDLVYTPDPEEQNVLINLLVNIFDTFPQFQTLIKNLLLTKIQQFLNNQAYSFTIKLVLQFFIQYYRFIFSKGSYTPIDEFKNFFVPLYHDPHLNDYECFISSISIQFCQRDPNCSIYMLKNLIHFWPQINSTKQGVFLNHISIIAPLTNPDDLYPLFPSIFSLILQSLKSSNYKVNLACLKIISDQSFNYLFSNQPMILDSELFELVESLQNHWNNDVKIQANETAKVVNELTFQSNRSNNQKDLEKDEENKKSKEITRDDKWEVIKQMALDQYDFL